MNTVQGIKLSRAAALVALWLLTCAAILTLSVIWELRTIPDPALPEIHTQPSYALPGIHELLNHSAKADSNADPRYVINIRNMDKNRLQAHLKVLGPKLGWHVRNAGFDNLTVALPETDLGQIEELAQDPVAWTLKAKQRPPAASAYTQGLVNVTLDLDGYRGRSPLPIIIIIISALILFFSAIIAIVATVSE